MRFLAVPIIIINTKPVDRISLQLNRSPVSVLVLFVHGFVSDVCRLVLLLSRFFSMRKCYTLPPIVAYFHFKKFLAG